MKPKPVYCAENLAACGLAGSDVLMVGNNTVEDGAFSGLGADLYLVADHLLDPTGAGVGNPTTLVRAVREGVLAGEYEAFYESWMSSPAAKDY